MRIVIVEDEILIREGVIKLVRRLSPDSVFVGEAGNGRDGMKLILAQRPDLVVTDIRMPDMDGLSMLEAVREQGCSCRAIVLTAYSEFAYARQAVKLGVVEYLLKPIVIDDFIQALRRVERMTAQEAAEPKHPEALRSLRVIYRALLSGMALDREVEQYLQAAYNIDAAGVFTLAMLYPCRALNEADWSALHAIKQSLCLACGDSARLVDLPSERMVALVMAGDGASLPHIIREGLPAGAYVAGYCAVHGLGKLQSAMRFIVGRMEYALSVDSELLNMDDLPAEASLRPLTYPVALEQAAKAAVWARDERQMQQVCRQFLTTVLEEGEILRPREIKECCVRFLWALVSAAAERSQTAQPERQALLERVMSAMTRRELTAAMEWLIQTLLTKQEAAAPASDLVARARAQVREYYGAGVTLEEIAARLKVTPEYLSQQFHREMGVRFSAYIRDLRIQKAKELLRVTDLKVYEIARRVGYADAKYFAKVFKQESGMMPGEYRVRE